MAWVRLSDTAGNHPILSRCYDLDYCDSRLKNELFGFVMLCTTKCALFFTDYIIERSAAREIAGMDRADVLIDAALRTGYFTATVKDEKTGRFGYRLIDDPQDLFHMILAAEKDWEKSRKRDLGDTQLKGKVRMRDGDHCRWCGVIVNWKDRKGARAGTYDHAVSFQPANGDPEKMYVSCDRCNKSRQDGAEWNVPLRPAPDNPYYSDETVKQLSEWGYIVQPSNAPLFVEVDPNSVEPHQVPEGTASLEKSVQSPAAPVWTPVEPETLAPVADRQLSQEEQFGQDLLDAELQDNAPGTKPVEATLHSSPSDSQPVERETPAPERENPEYKRQTGISQISARYQNRNTDECSPESGFVGSGRVGTGKNSTQAHSNSDEKPKRKRRRRRGKKNGNESKS